MSTWSTGSKVEKLRRKKLESEGWLVRTWPKAMYNQQDLWGCDLIAVRTGEIRFEQIKSNTSRMPAVLEETLEELTPLWEQLPEEAKIYWVGYNIGKKEWKILEIVDPQDRGSFIVV